MRTIRNYRRYVCKMHRIPSSYTTKECYVSQLHLATFRVLSASLTCLVNTGSVYTLCQTLNEHSKNCCVASEEGQPGTAVKGLLQYSRNANSLYYSKAVLACFVVHDSRPESSPELCPSDYHITDHHSFVSEKTKVQVFLCLIKTATRRHKASGGSVPHILKH
jgi:hypothetical protein